MNTRRMCSFAGAVGAAAVAVAGASGAPRGPLEGTIAFDLGTRVVVQDVSGANRRVIPTPRQEPGMLVWSRDGSAVALVRYDEPRRTSDVYVATVGDRSLTRIAHLPGFVGEPIWSPDGTQLASDWQSPRACDRGTTGTTSIYVADARGGGAKRLTSVEPTRPSTKRTPFYQMLDWSPDGTRLLYGNEQWRTGGDCGLRTSDDQLSGSLLHVGLAGGRPTVIRGGDAGQAEWSPDGRLIAMCGNGVTVVRRDGSLVRRWPGRYSASMACGIGSGRWLTWSHDGDEVYAATDDRVVALRIRDGRTRSLLDLVPVAKCTGNFNCSINILSRSNDGHFLIVHADGGRLDIHALFALAVDGTRRYRLRASYQYPEP